MSNMWLLMVRLLQMGFLAETVEAATLGVVAVVPGDFKHTREEAETLRSASVRRVID